MFQEKVNGAEWAAMTNQFFTVLITPLNAKALEVWARPFDIKRDEGPTLLGMEGAMGMPGFQLQPGTAATMRFQLYVGPKLYGRLAKLEHDEAEIMNFGMWKLVSQALLNFMNLIHGCLEELRRRDFRFNCVRQRRSLAASEQGEQIDAQDVRARAQNAGAEGNIKTIRPG